MGWIPPGALVAGTPLGVLPRVADEEMAGEQVILKGFFMSVYPYPNEEGAIPLGNVTEEQAKGLCEERHQRLCTELEWERACKGPDNHLYEYGDRYRADVCGTGTEPRMLPSGLRVACRSDFGVRDMHGSLLEWTGSPWGRGRKEGLVTVRGGNAPAGEVAGRCANAMGRAATSKAPSIGFRCCAGPENEAKVELHVDRKTPLEARDLSAVLARRLEAALPDDARAELRRDESFHAARAWLWHPIGNEELVVAGGCTGEHRGRGCGVVVARLVLGEPVALAWAGSGRYVPSLKLENDSRYLWVYGGDERSHYRRLLTYAWGRVVEGEIQRNVKANEPRRK
jgi:sulfatase modifying factor 1